MLCILGAAFVEHNWYIFGAVWQSIIGRFLSISHSPLLIQDFYEGGGGGGGGGGGVGWWWLLLQGVGGGGKYMFWCFHMQSYQTACLR